MATPMNILIVEDSPDDADLLVAELRRAGFDPKWKRVETEPDFLAELERKPDLILSDYSLPQFNGLLAAELVKASGLDIPFILISGTVGEDTAVEAMKRGATDYLLKDRIARLGPAVERALEQKRLRRQRRQAEESLRQSEHRFREMLANLKLIAMTLDTQGRVTFCNDYLLEVTGYQRKEIIGADWFEKFIPENNTELKKMFFETVAIGAVSAHHENPIKTSSGELRDIFWNNTTLRDGSGNIIGTASIGEDVTERKNAEEGLRESEEKFRQIAENINEVFWITDATMHEVVYVSPAYEKIWGRSCESLYASSRQWLEAIHPEDQERILKAAAAFVVSSIYDVEFRIIRPDKSIRWIHDRGFPIRNAAGEVYRIVGVAEDITEHRKLEEQFRQAQKMEAFGQLAGGVAHDFNNILAIIQIQAGLLKAGGLPPAQAKFADEIGTTVDRAADLTSQLLIFSRKQSLQPHDLDLNELANSMAKMLLRILGEDIGLQLQLAPRPMFVHADAGMMDQVLMNLAVNARDAMAKGGRLVIETSAVDFDASVRAQSAQACPGPFVCLSVGDNGCGIPSEILPRIFEPFFTTKEVGKGTGLGLATVFSIVQQHHGWINVESEVGHGTTVKIYLPRLSGMTTANIAQKMLALTPTGKETILLVEDEPSLRIIIQMTLAQLGYRILEAASGVKALKVWQEHRTEIGLLLTDLMMPDGMNGKELAQRLRQENPKLKVIFMSGYSPDIAGQDFPLQAGVNFLAKPFQLQALAQIIRDSLDKSG